jgi:hypothetical protein
LLSGQITAQAIWVVSAGFGITVGGPITGNSRLVGKSKGAKFIIDVIDIVLAVLLISGQIVITGIFVGPAQYSVVLSGPIFGTPRVTGKLPDPNKIYRNYKKYYRF